MPTENTSLKDTTPAGGSNTTNEMVTGKINIYQLPFLIVAGSLLASLALVAVTGKSVGHHFKLFANEIPEGAGALANNQVDTTNLALAKDIFGITAISKNEDGLGCNHRKHCCYRANHDYHSGQCSVYGSFVMQIHCCPCNCISKSPCLEGCKDGTPGTSCGSTGNPPLNGSTSTLPICVCC